MDALEISINKLKITPQGSKIIDYILINNLIDNIEDFNEDIDRHTEIIIDLETYRYDYAENKVLEFSFTMTQAFKDALKAFFKDAFIEENQYKEKLKTLKTLFINLININYYDKHINYFKLDMYKEKIVSLKMIKLANVSTSGGKKTVVKYTVKDLQAIAIENKIKITKKVEGKTVRLNKQGMIAKLKRHKLI